MVDGADYAKLSFVAYESMLTAAAKTEPYNNILVSISGGSDSDILLDMLLRSVPDHSKLNFVFFDTGLEYQATKRHLDYLEQKYNITIHRLRAKKPIPTCVREFGEPFKSKMVSELMSRLQKHGFQWEDEPYDELILRYPKCSAALKWWCNEHKEGSAYNIAHHKWLKEFILANPPQFRISNKCCDWAKKNIAKGYKKENNIDLNVIGLRRAEGGARQLRYKNCFDQKENGISEYRPIWWYTDEDKKSYEDACGIIHSECYTKYGLTRTGCSGCPFGRNFEEELAIIEEHEPKLFKAVNNIFKNSYDYTRKYREFVKMMNAKTRRVKP